jgi:gas vesicle protein
MAEQAHRNPLVVPLLAGLVGAGLALLFAPRSGRETREKLRMSTQESMDSAREKLDAAITQGKELKDRLEGAVKTTGRRMSKSKSNDQQDETQSAAMITSWEQEV